jgi:hypothetical protein
MAAGRRWVVDVDLEKFFDGVNHDVLMTRVKRRVKDRRVPSSTFEFGVSSFDRFYFTFTGLPDFAEA